jgi:hypothetical protein
MTTLLFALTTLSPLNSEAKLGEVCDPQTQFCIFIRGDATLLTQVSAETIMSLTINRAVLEYPEKLTINPSAFEVIGLSTKFLSDTKVNHLKFAIYSISGQSVAPCEVSTLNNKAVLPGLHVMTLSATRDNNNIQYHCAVEQ